jgi:hypothetical protein
VPVAFGRSPTRCRREAIESRAAMPTGAGGASCSWEPGGHGQSAAGKVGCAGWVATCDGGGLAVSGHVWSPRLARGHRSGLLAWGRPRRRVKTVHSGHVGRPPECHTRCGPWSRAPRLRSRLAAPKRAASIDRNHRWSRPSAGFTPLPETLTMGDRSDAGPQREQAVSFSRQRFISLRARTAGTRRCWSHGPPATRRAVSERIRVSVRARLRRGCAQNGRLLLGLISAASPPACRWADFPCVPRAVSPDP